MTLKDIKAMNEEQLVKEIEKNNKLYWEESNPAISDEEFDLLVRRLEEINPGHEILKKYYAPKVSSIGVVHASSASKMISLEKTYFFSDAPKGKKSLMDWASDRARDENELFLIQPKYDGISAYYDGKILATRGQGTVDQNVSDKIPLIELETTGYTGPLDRPVRGEIIIRNDDFKTIYSDIKRKGGGSYKNSRNAVSGIMGLKEIDDMLEQGAKLTLVDYSLISHEVSITQFPEKWNSILESIELTEYPIDGLVIKLKDIEYRESLGATAMYPKGMIAWKLTGQRKQTTLKDVEWSFGKNNLTPKGILEPIELSGVTISNVTLHNYKFLRDKDIKIGDYLTIERAGEVIPHVVDIEPGKERKSPYIENCPSCKSPVEIVGVELRCANPKCPEKSVQRLCAAVKNLDIEELGEPTIRKMIEQLNVKKLKDIINLTFNDIYQLDGFKEKSATKLYNNIQKSRNTTDYQLLAALNITGVGQTFAKQLLKNFTLDELRKMTPEELSEIEQVGPIMSVNIHNAFNEKSEIIDELTSALNLTMSKISGNSSNKNMKTVCFTGKMPEKRSYYENKAIQKGYEPVDKVNKSLSLLVTAENNSQSSKAIKAQKLGIAIVPLDKWLQENGSTDVNTSNDGMLPGF